ncbi:hypothetical protein LXA43DRAFT_901051 [Ganoderma leucocontextum]|nr:hypothetical protein LXA43DRAFT_901051 [Ganoderma leucocontextum]
MTNKCSTSASSSRSYAYANRSGYTSPTPKSQLVPAELDEPDEFFLTDDEANLLKPSAGPRTREEMEEELWDERIANAIDKLNGTIDLSGSSLRRGVITHIPPSIADLEGFIVLPQTHSPSSAPPSPTLSPTLSHSGPSRPFARATTLAAPRFDAPFFRSRDGERLRGTPAARTASLQAVVQQPTAQRRRRDIQIYLANNFISKLPPELFRVNALTVLSLRSNELTFVPPQIAQLTALQELNLAQNKLRWLPAEMLGMRLTKLTVSGNPWLPPPLLPQQAYPPTSGSAETRRPVSDTIVRFTIPPLSEICLRILLTPSKPAMQPSLTHSAILPPASTSSTSASSSRHAHTVPEPPPDTPAQQLTVLEARYALPLSEDDHYSPALLTTLRVCVPAAVARPAESEHHGRAKVKVRRDDARRDVHSGRSCSPPRAPARDREDSKEEDEDVFSAPRVVEEEMTGVSKCPSPVHRAGNGVFVRHAEERWTWEEVVAGVHVGAESGGGGVPVRWRGCSRGCLAFLDPPPLQPPALASVQEQGDSEVGEEEQEAELDLDIGGGGGDFGVADVEMDMEDIW